MPSQATAVPAPVWAEINDPNVPFEDLSAEAAGVLLRACEAGQDIEDLVFCGGEG